MTLIYFLMRMKKGNVMLQKIKQKVQILFLQCRRFPLLVKYKLEYRQGQCYSLLVWPEVQMNVILRGIVKQLKLFHFLSSRQKSLYSCAITPLKQVRGKNCLLKGYSMKKKKGVKIFFLWTSTFCLHQADRKRIYFHVTWTIYSSDIFIFDALDRNWSFINRNLREAWFPWNNY